MLRTTIVLMLVCLVAAQVQAAAASVRVKVPARSDGSPQVDRFLFGGFIELLDDLVPGMRAEMLNDRGFDGVLPSANWCYRDGEPNICDREWEPNDTWTYDSGHPELDSGPTEMLKPVQHDVTRASELPRRSAKLTPRAHHPASLTQSGLAVDKGMTYLFSGHFASRDSGVRAQIVLKTLLPDGKWMELASCALPSCKGDWRKVECKMISKGTTDRAVFELRATGNGALRADKLSLMPMDNMKGWRKDVVQAIKDANVSLIRWGGSVVDPGGYRWQDGIGDPDSRTPFPNKVWGRIDSNDVGIDEFLQFCELVNAEPLVCVSFSGGAESARDMIEYCNGAISTKWGAKRAANGHPKPYGVRLWQLGNELGDQTYVDGCPAFCKAIREADPEAKILASFPSKALLEKVGPSLDFICPHHYTDDLGACDADFKNLAALTASTPGCEKIKIGVTEWNVSAGAWGVARGGFLTLISALRNARYLNLMIRHSGTATLACRSNMTNSLGSGMIQTKPAGLYKAPSYHVMKLYADHAKQVYVPIQGSPEALDIAATASADGKSLCIFAVNTSAEPVELALDLSTYPGLRCIGGEIVQDTLDRRQAEVVNGWARPDRVRAVALGPTSGSITVPAFSASAVEIGAP